MNRTPRCARRLTAHRAGSLKLRLSLPLMSNVRLADKQQYLSARPLNFELHRAGTMVMH